MSHFVNVVFVTDFDGQLVAIDEQSKSGAQHQSCQCIAKWHEHISPLSELWCSPGHMLRHQPVCPMYI